jgi:hypothetical protein
VLDESADPAALSGSSCGSTFIALAPTSAHVRKDVAFPALLVLKTPGIADVVREACPPGTTYLLKDRARDFQLDS